MPQRPPQRRAHPAVRIRPELRGLIVVGVLAVALCAIIAVVQRGSDGSGRTLAQSPAATHGADLGAAPGTLAATSTARADPTNAAAAGTDPATVGAGASTTATDPGASTTVAGDGAVGPDLDGADPDTGGGTCTMTQRVARQGDTGPDVVCIQKAMITQGLLTGTPSGTFDTATYNAIKSLQTKKDMFVDGVVGRETALSLGVWPDEASLVVHTAKPAAGAKDLLGYALSTVAVSGPGAPPLPANSGSGRRLVYSRSGQRVWAVDKDNAIIRSWLVSGSKYNNETPGTHTVYSRSETSTAWNGKAILPHMVRYQKTSIGNIGFHGIPIHVADGTAYMTEDQLGTRLSGGCQRQANLDADFTWAFAQIGTTVVVL